MIRGKAIPEPGPRLLRWDKGLIILKEPKPPQVIFLGRELVKLKLKEEVFLGKVRKPDSAVDRFF